LPFRPPHANNPGRKAARRARADPRTCHRTPAPARRSNRPCTTCPVEIIHFEISSGPSRGPENEAQPFRRRADHRHSKGARGGHPGLGAEPQAGRQRCQHL
jgi:hypothetical protein